MHQISCIIIQYSRAYPSPGTCSFVRYGREILGKQDRTSPLMERALLQRRAQGILLRQRCCVAAGETK
jgi:hypothetical protein